MTQDELYHYGVLGMKWGKRKANPSYDAYRQTKKDYRSSVKEYRKASRKTIVPSLTGFGIKGISKYKKAEDNMKKAEANMKKAQTNVSMAKAKYNASKAKTAEKAEKAEFKTYKKEMNKTGLVGSASDTNSGGKSTRLYNEIKAQKGKAYADKVQKSLEKKYVRNLVGSTAVMAGYAALIAYGATIKD